MRVKITIERTTVEEAEVELELDDDVDPVEFDYAEEMEKSQEVDGATGESKLHVDWDLVSQAYDASGEPEVVG